MDYFQLAFVAVFGVGLGVSSGGLCYSALRLLKAPRLALPRRKSREMPPVIRRFLHQGQGNEDELPPWLKQWSERTSLMLKRSGVHIPVMRYLVGLLAGGAGGFITGVTLMKNLPAAVILALSIALAPDVVLIGRVQNRRNKIIEQLAAAVRIFAAEFGDTPQVPRALSITAQKVPAPLGDILRQADTDLAAGKSIDDVCLYLMKELDFEYGRMFVQLLRLAWDDAAVRPLFTRLAGRIANLQGLIYKNASGMAYSRFMGMFVNALILPEFLLMRSVVPETGYFLVYNPLGRLLVVVCFLSILVGMILDRVLSGVET
ncbi:hypothetical protein MOOR_16380 [Moorella thermoacetica]|uniref:Type II secretion system protein GspF domain-containing protein n=1 Tax=Neomoorella thermoacetica TaxID=1525 RepID=A0A1J5JVW6_NEOTH|nr:hypothetical protein [Moorella thermoacetica]OIQ08719.1 hypothetical protein MOOR_16380 [Moorella thermoacetica]